MPVVKILKHWPSAENYEVGEEYDISNVGTLIAEGKVEIVDQPHEKGPEPVSVEEPEEKIEEPVIPEVIPEEPIKEVEEPIKEEKPETDEPLEQVK